LQSRAEALEPVWPEARAAIQTELDGSRVVALIPGVVRAAVVRALPERVCFRGALGVVALEPELLDGWLLESQELLLVLAGEPDATRRLADWWLAWLQCALLELAEIQLPAGWLRPVGMELNVVRKLSV
jgi:hypothetical protein